jgi:hypothetical protein
MENNFSLDTIAYWQFNDESEVSLPKIQRGFVWKYEQIENLWDSLLRKFPIGSFLLAESSENKYFLMDGQQRATAIALGFYDPFRNKMKAWSIKGTLPVIWIDIKPKKDDMGDRKYLFRVTTRSQPWGYRQNSKQNKGILSISDKRNALHLFEQHIENKEISYTKFKNTSIFPYDAYYPIPISFIINEVFGNNDTDPQNIAKKVIGDCRNFLPEYFKTKHSSFSSKEKFIQKLEGNLFENLVSICRRFIGLSGTRINYDSVAKEILLTEDNVNDDTSDPTLFVRINSSGTSLNGDDLIYSIYKALFPQTKDLVEKIGRDFILPTQIINIVSRIAIVELDKKHEYQYKITVKSFQQKIKKPAFRKKLAELIGTEGASPIKMAFDTAINVLLQQNTINIPPIIVKSLVKRSQNMFMFLVYWIYKNGNVFKDDGICVIAKIMLFSYFSISGEEESTRRLWDDYSKKTIWEMPINKYFGETLLPIVKPDILYEFYSNDTITKHFLDDNYIKNNDVWVLPQNIKIGKKVVKYYRNTLKYPLKKFDDEKLSTFFSDFVNKLFYEKSLVLFAQRDYINREFRDFNQLDELEDTDAPWDWDHIYPDSWIYNKKNILATIREWNWCIGNFRAISLSQNRSENNSLSPAERLDDEEVRGISFVLDNDWEYWGKIVNRTKDKDDIQNLYCAISIRMINIYKEWYDKLKIDKLI